MNAITVVLGHDSDQGFILQNTNFDVDDPRALFDSLSQSLEVKNLAPELEKIATDTFEEKRRIKMTDRAVDASFASTGRPGAKLSQKSIDNDATLPFTVLTGLKEGYLFRKSLLCLQKEANHVIPFLLWLILSVLQVLR